jgi:hypothetical protein
VSIRTRTWINSGGKTNTALVVAWTDEKKKRRLKTFERMRHAKAFHAMVNHSAPTRRLQFVAALETIRAGLARGKKIILTREQAEAIVKTFPR